MPKPISYFGMNWSSIERTLLTKLEGEIKLTPEWESGQPSKVLTQEQVSGIMNGSFRIYLLMWSKWKDSRDHVGYYDKCLWLQTPNSIDLASQNLPRHPCGE